MSQSRLFSAKITLFCPFSSLVERDVYNSGTCWRDIVPSEYPIFTMFCALLLSVVYVRLLVCPLLLVLNSLSRLKFSPLSLHHSLSTAVTLTLSLPLSLSHSLSHSLYRTLSHLTQAGKHLGAHRRSDTRNFCS